MWCCLSDEEKLEKEAVEEQTRVSNEIDRQLKRESRNSQHQVKILIFGMTGSGKSTFIKQMRIIHGGGYSEEDKRSFIKLICQNTITAIQVLLFAKEDLQIPFTDSANHENADLIKSVNIETVNTLESPYFEAIRSLWNDVGIQECYDRRIESYSGLLRTYVDPAKYFLNDLDRIASPDYLPTEQDILRAKDPTTSRIIEYAFELNYDNAIISMTDVSGLRMDRRKWIYCFEGVKAVMFFVDLSEYDQIAYGQSRLEESKNLFNTILSYHLHRNSSMILCFNKKDIFEEKIKYSHLATYFPEYDGPQKDANEAQEFIFSWFLNQFHPDLEKLIYPYFKCAVDTENIKFMFSAMKVKVLIHKNPIL